MTRYVYTAICLFAFSFASFALAEPDGSSTIASILKSSATTRDRMLHETVRWTTAIELPVKGATMEVSIVQSTNGRELTASTVEGGQSQQLVGIIVQDGVWYVVHNGTIAKYRPYEAPLMLPSLYLFLARADRCIVDEGQLATAKFETADGNIATFRVPLGDAARRQVQSAVATMEKVKQLRPNTSNPEVEATLPRLQEVLERGVNCKVDITTGVVVESGPPGNRQQVKNFRFSPLEAPAPLPNALTSAVDRTAPLVDRVDRLEDLVVMGHAGAWAPGQPSIDTDFVLVNLRDGEMRRVPYPGAGTGPSCFSKDRRSIFTTALVVDEGGLGLFQIDLAKGTLRRIGEHDLGGMTMFPALSPDGQTLVVATKFGQEAGILEWQICLVDIATGNVAKIGKPMDTAFISWLPDQSGLILVTRENREMNARSEETISRMELNGRITPIRKGSFPIVLSPERRMLFLDEADNKRWKTCDLDGQNEKIVGDGLSGFGFPAASPDGKRALMMRFAKSTGPRPYIVDIETGAAKPVIASEGLWVLPAWR